MNPFRHAVALTAAVLLSTVSLLGPATAAPPSSPTATPGVVQVEVPEIDLTGGPRVLDVPVTVTNHSGAGVRALTVSFSGPVGWPSAPESVSFKGVLRPGNSEVATFQLHVPSQSSGFAVRTFTATATYRGGDGHGSATGSRMVVQGSPYASLAAARNGISTTTVETIPNGNFDGYGNSFGAPQLADHGLTPGAAVQAIDATFTWPDVAPGTAADSVTAQGQAITVDGQGGRLALLGSGSSFGASGIVTVYYADGTSSTGSFGFPNWSFDSLRYGVTSVAGMAGRHTPSGPANFEYTYSVFATSIPIDPTKEVLMVLLPANSSIHLFDMVIAP